MEKNLPKRRGRLGTTLVLWFFLLALVPLSVVSIIGYRNVYQSLDAGKKLALKSVTQAKAEYISYVFDTIIKDLNTLSQREENARLLEDLSQVFGKSGKSSQEFVKSFKAQMIFHERSGEIKNFQKIHGYYDIFLIDLTGNILFSVMGEDDLGTNLFDGPYSGTLFAAACRKTLETGRITFSDFERYGASNNEVSGFLVQTMVDDYGDKSGLMAFQIHGDEVDRIMQHKSGLGETEDVYLIGADLRMRSNSARDDQQTILGQPVETMQTLRWKEHHIDSGIDKHAPGYTAEIYTGPRGVSVLGIHQNLKIAGTPFGIIAEIDEAEAFASALQLSRLAVILLLVTSIVVVIIAVIIARRIVRPVQALSEGVSRVAAGDLEGDVIVDADNEMGQLADNFTVMLANLRRATRENIEKDWFRKGQFGLDEKMRGDQAVEELGRGVITYVADYLGAGIGALYLNNGKDVFTLIASHAYKTRKNLSNQFTISQGLVGQAAYEKQTIMLTKVPDDYIVVSSGLGEKKPNVILVVPLIYNETVTGVMELGTFGSFTDEQRAFLDEIAGSIAITLNSAMSHLQLDQAFQKSRQLTEELQAQQEELQAANEELEDQTRRLQASEEELKAQQEELQAANEELEGKTYSLEEQREEVNEKNKELLITQGEIKQKARELEITSKYKSEFLANMSHELRTPLNSLLILSQDLAGNKLGNLNDDQVESANIIYNSGNDLLKLINEILDLSKIEAGKMTLTLDTFSLQESADWLQANFKRLAQEKGLAMNIVVDSGLPEQVKTDRQRLDQILKNLLSNALKFTAQGSVTVTYGRPAADVDLSRSGLDSGQCVAISVSDTGIGIPQDKQLAIFEAFQQVDGSTSRQYGGTGLGLSISRELAKLLEGELQLESILGEGSTFTFFLPITLDRRKKQDSERRQEEEKATAKITSAQQPVVMEKPTAGATAAALSAPSIDDDRENIGADDKTILVIEDDPRFAAILGSLCRERAFKFIHAGSGEVGLQLAEQFKPVAIILDIRLPGIQGMTVLDILKNEQSTRHIPVHMMSVEDRAIDALQRGAIGFLSKPVGREDLDAAFGKIEEMISGHIRRLLVVEDDPIQMKSIRKLIGNGDVETIGVTTGTAALEKLESEHFDCMILDLKLPDMTGFEVLKKLDQQGTVSIPPVIVYTGKEISPEEEAELRKYASSVIIKGVRSPERLLDETALFLHRVVDKLPEQKQKMIATLHDADALFAGKRVLVVDDDMRNVFAVSKILEDKGFEVFKAINGQKALDILTGDGKVDLVLMDIMMPIMDGYETMRRIRAMAEFRNLPIIALTAKAMQEDRLKCIEAGANDYLAKPIDVDRLLSLIRVWLYR